jgi:two-component system cell cycle sensor histidine kinase/response regulator CckA
MSKPPSTGGTGILVIDDEPEILQTLKPALEAEGWTVHTAATPWEGLRLYEQRWRDIGLVLLDYLLPEMQGDELFEALQQLNPDVRVLLLTACDDIVARRLFEHGLRGYIQKPFFMDDLIARVRDELGCD